MAGFVKPQAAGIDGGEIGVVVQGLTWAKMPRTPTLKTVGRRCRLGAQDRENVPIAGQNVDVEKANAAVADAHGLGDQRLTSYAGSTLQSGRNQVRCA